MHALTNASVAFFAVNVHQSHASTPGGNAVIVSRRWPGSASMNMSAGIARRTPAARTDHIKQKNARHVVSTFMRNRSAAIAKRSIEFNLVQLGRRRRLGGNCQDASR